MHDLMGSKELEQLHFSGSGSRTHTVQSTSATVPGGPAIQQSCHLQCAGASTTAQAALSLMSTFPLLRDPGTATWFQASNFLHDHLQACSFCGVSGETLNTPQIQLPAYTAALGPLDHSLCAGPGEIPYRRFFSYQVSYCSQLVLQL